MSDRAGEVLARIRRKAWPYTDIILSAVTLGFILVSWVLSLFGSNTLVVTTIVAAIGVSSAGLANVVNGGISLTRADIRDRLPAGKVRESGLDGGPWLSGHGLRLRALRRECAWRQSEVTGEHVTILATGKCVAACRCAVLQWPRRAARNVLCIRKEVPRDVR
jgi:hypothetical protein